MKHLFLLIAVALTSQVNAENYRDMEFPTLEVPVMTIESFDLFEPIYEYRQSNYNFDRVDLLASPSMELSAAAGKWKPDFDFFMDARPLVSGEPLKTNNIKVKK